VSMLVSAERVVTPARTFAPGWLLLEGELVADVQPGPPPRPADIDLPGANVVPGFVDAHVHGGGGASFDAGDQEAAATVARAHLGHGTTTMMASLVSDGLDSLARSVGELAELVADGLLAGIHLEGP
jgi:N-acetylglucosamine-6-phosphate deacetylase